MLELNLIMQAEWESGQECEMWTCSSTNTHAAPRRSWTLWSQITLICSNVTPVFQPWASWRCTTCTRAARWRSSTPMWCSTSAAWCCTERRPSPSASRSSWTACSPSWSRRRWSRSWTRSTGRCRTTYEDTCCRWALRTEEASAGVRDISGKVWLNTLAFSNGLRHNATCMCGSSVRGAGIQWSGSQIDRGSCLNITVSLHIKNMCACCSCGHLMSDKFKDTCAASGCSWRSSRKTLWVRKKPSIVGVHSV